MEKIKIQRIDGRWLVNEKRYEELCEEEKDFLSKFLQHMKFCFEKEEETKKFKKVKL